MPRQYNSRSLNSPPRLLVSPSRFMPAFDLDSQSPGGSFEPQPSDNWSMPLGAVAGIRLSVSYSVFVAFAVLSGLVAMVQGRQGNSDLPWVALTAVTIWCFGWVVQLCVQLCLHFWSSAKSESITIGLLHQQLHASRRKKIRDDDLPSG